MIRVLSIVLGALLLAGCGESGLVPSAEQLPTYRYKLTVEVDTPDGVRSGSSVIEVRSQKLKGVSGRAVSRDVFGEAVAVDLPNGQTLFALLIDDPELDPGPGEPDYNRGDAGHIAQYLFDDQIYREPGFVGGDRNYESLVTALSKGGYQGELTRGLYPMLVRFRDINDPTTVERVDPDGPYAVRKMTVEVGDFERSQTLERRISWLTTQDGSLVTRPPNTSVGSLPLGGRLTSYDFQRNENP